MYTHAYQLRAALASWLSLTCVAAPPVHIGSDDWCPYICAASKAKQPPTGFLVDITHDALAANGYQAVPELLPLNRAMTLTLSGKLDGIYAPEIDPRLRMTQPIIQSRACFYTLQDSHWRYGGIDSIQGRSLGVIADYGYDAGPMDAYLGTRKPGASNVDFNVGDNAGAVNVQKLLGRRYEIVLEHQTVMAHLLKQLGATAGVREAGCLDTPLPLVIGFSATRPDVDQLVRSIDEGVKRMKSNGEFDRLRQTYSVIGAQAAGVHSRAQQ